MKLRVIDFETTGIPDEDEEHSVCEAAYVDASTEDGFFSAYSSLVIPTTEMSIEALATHHINDFTGAISWEEAQEKITDNKAIYVAHNADFEKEFFNPDGSQWIDTWKCALRLYPDSPRHTNQVLKYYLEIPDDHTHHPPHRALPDCYVTAQILKIMLEQKSVEDMIRVSNEPPYLTKISFGKHSGEKFKDLPPSYLDWLSKQSDMDDGVKAAVKRVMNK